MNKRKKGRLRKAFLAGVFAISTTGCQTLLPNKKNDTFITEGLNGEFIHHVVDNEPHRIRYNFNQFCVTANDNELKLSSIQNSLEILKNSSEFGKYLYNFAQQENIHFCRQSNLLKGATATYTSGLNVIKFGTVRNSDLKRLSTIAHEIVHGIQDKNKILFIDLNWDLQNNIKKTLAIEAAANIASITLAFDMKQNGKHALWNFLHHNAKQKPLFNAITSKNLNIFEENYINKRKLGLNHKGAMEFSMGKIWPEMFKVKSWKKYYINNEISNYQNRLEKGLINEDTIIKEDLYNLIVEEIGNIGTYNFSRYIKNYNIEPNTQSLIQIVYKKAKEQFK